MTKEEILQICEMVEEGQIGEEAAFEFFRKAREQEKAEEQEIIGE